MNTPPTPATADAPPPAGWIVTAWHCGCHPVNWYRRTPSPPGRPAAPGVPAGVTGGLFWHDTVDEFLAEHRDVVPVDVDNPAALLAELAQARTELADADMLRERMGSLLDGAAALKGDPPPLVLHDWSDLPACAATAVAELAQAEAEQGRLSRENADWRRLVDTLRDIQHRLSARFEQVEAERDAYRPATIGSGDHAGAWHLHQCGQPELWPAATGPEDGGCDACESGSPNASDWRALYVRTGAQ
jgi:hypothetical protein